MNSRFLRLCIIVSSLFGLLFLLIRSVYRNGFDPNNDISAVSAVYPVRSTVQNHGLKLLVYNRVPKTGGTSLVRLVYNLCDSNHVAATMVNISWSQIYLNRFNQYQLIQNMSSRSYTQPMMLHGHFVFLDFNQFGSRLRPVYINMIRDPLERLVSHYYFLRFGDTFRPNVIRKRMNGSARQQSFDECVINGGLDCNPENLWVQVPFFCGHAAYCRIPGSLDALATAKRRVTEDYLIVGLTELFDEFVILLEKLLPRFFRGSTTLLRNSDEWHLRRTKFKQPINASTRAFFETNLVWKVEQAFYDFVRNEFWAIRNAILRGSRIDVHRKTGLPNDMWIRQRFWFQRNKP